jgi:hypothetical protein
MEYFAGLDEPQSRRRDRRNLERGHVGASFCRKKYVASLWFAVTPRPTDRTKKRGITPRRFSESRFWVEDQGESSGYPLGGFPILDSSRTADLNLVTVSECPDAPDSASRPKSMSA